MIKKEWTITVSSARYIIAHSENNLKRKRGVSNANIEIKNECIKQLLFCKRNAERKEFRLSLLNI